VRGRPAWPASANVRDVQVPRSRAIPADGEAVEATADQGKRVGGRPRQVAEGAQVGQRVRKGHGGLAIQLAGLPRDGLHEGERRVEPLPEQRQGLLRHQRQQLRRPFLHALGLHGPLRVACPRVIRLLGIRRPVLQVLDEPAERGGICLPPPRGLRPHQDPCGLAGGGPVRVESYVAGLEHPTQPTRGQAAGHPFAEGEQCAPPAG